MYGCVQQKADDAMTPELCFASCGSTQYAGLEYGRECWCADYLSALSVKLSESNCSVPCGGDNTTICGGPLTYVPHLS